MKNSQKMCTMLNGTLATLIACMCRRCYGLAPAADKRIIKIIAAGEEVEIVHTFYYLVDHVNTRRLWYCKE